VGEVRVNTPFPSASETTVEGEIAPSELVSAMVLLGIGRPPVERANTVIVVFSLPSAATLRGQARMSELAADGILSSFARVSWVRGLLKTTMLVNVANATKNNARSVMSLRSMYPILTIPYIIVK